MPLKVGIPRALYFYRYFPFWKVFFQQLGTEVVISQSTSKEVLDAGVREAVTDACVPVKLYFGHVLDLKRQVDFLFIPRIVNLNGATTYCPKFLGLPDMIKHSLADLPPILAPRFDVRKGRRAYWENWISLGLLFTKNRLQVIKAYYHAWREQNRYDLLLKNGSISGLPLLQTLQPADKFEQQQSLNFGVIGYPYAVFDPFISVGLLDKLYHLGINIWTMEMLPPKTLAAMVDRRVKRAFWTFSDQAIAAARYFLRNPDMDGLIHVTAFGCGPDFMVNKMIELEAKKAERLPFMSVMIDEHTGEAGITTRIEAFVDLVRRRREA